MDRSTAWKTYYKVSKGLADLSRFFLECDLPEQAKLMYKSFDSFESIFLECMNQVSFEKEGFDEN